MACLAATNSQLHGARGERAETYRIANKRSENSFSLRSSRLITCTSHQGKAIPSEVCVIAKAQTSKVQTSMAVNLEFPTKEAKRAHGAIPNPNVVMLDRVSQLN